MSNQSNQNIINVEYVLALEKSQTIESALLPSNTTLEEALTYFDLDKQARKLIKSPEYGVFNQRIELDHKLKAGDRIEVYRPLVIDPKEARKIRAQRNKTDISSTQITELR